MAVRIGKLAKGLRGIGREHRFNFPMIAWLLGIFLLVFSGLMLLFAQSFRKAILQEGLSCCSMFCAEFSTGSSKLLLAPIF